MEAKKEPRDVQRQPCDRYNIVYMILLVHGVGTLLPWNMFITADNYFQQKLTIHDDTSNGTMVDLPYKDNFMNYITISSKLPNVIIQALNFLIQPKSRSLTNRILVSIVIEGVIFLVTAILAIVNSSSWPDVFFASTIISVILINVANGVYQNCVFGVTAILPMKYTNAVVTGMNISGVVSSLIMIISVASTPDVMVSALAYFMTAVIFLVICFVTYIIMVRNEFFIQSYVLSGKHRSDSSRGIMRSESGINVDSVSDTETRWTKYLDIVREIWPQLFNVFFTYFVSLSLFPSVLVNIDSTTGMLGKYWGVVTCFLSFNLSAMIGNLLVDWIDKKVPKHYLWIPTIARLLFIPFFLFCNVKPDKRTWTVLFPQDWIYSLGVVALAISTGYIGSLAMVYAPSCVSDPSNASTAGMMASFSLMIGIMAGIIFSNALTYIITV